MTCEDVVVCPLVKRRQQVYIQQPGYRAVHLMHVGPAEYGQVQLGSSTFDDGLRHRSCIYKATVGRETMDRWHRALPDTDCNGRRTVVEERGYTAHVQNHPAGLIRSFG